MSLGIKFRRNKKAQLTDIQPAEIVYAVDTDEWGLGLADNSVAWRTHFKEFYNILLSGTEIPNNLLGEIGNVYVNTTDSLGIYIKGFAGWDYYPHAKDRAYINANFLPSPNANYSDTSDLFDVLATQTEVDPTHVPTNLLDVSNFKYLENLYFLRDDGTTQMVDGYAPTTPQQPVTVGSFNTLVPPTTEPVEPGILWNDNGVPKISGFVPQLNCNTIGTISYTHSPTGWYNPYGKFPIDESTNIMYGMSNISVDPWVILWKLNLVTGAVETSTFAAGADGYFDMLELEIFNGSLYFCSPNNADQYDVWKFNLDTLVNEGKFTSEVIESPQSIITYYQNNRLGYNSINDTIYLTFVCDDIVTAKTKLGLMKINASTMAKIGGTQYRTDPDTAYDTYGHLGAVEYHSDTKLLHAIVPSSNVPGKIYQLDLETFTLDWEDSTLNVVDNLYGGQSWLIRKMDNGNVWIIYSSETIATYPVNYSLSIGLFSSTGTKLENYLFTENNYGKQFYWVNKHGPVIGGGFYVMMDSDLSDAAINTIHLFDANGSYANEAYKISGDLDLTYGNPFQCLDTEGWFFTDCGIHGADLTVEPMIPATPLVANQPPVPLAPYVGMLKQPIPEYYAFFGSDTAVLDTTIVVGSRLANDIGIGSVYVFDTNLNFIREIPSPEQTDYDQFGCSVDISSDRIVVGASGDNEVGGGAAYVFNLDGSLISKILPPASTNLFSFYDIKVHGDRIVVGSREDFFIYDKNGNFIKTMADPYGSLSFFGEYVGVSSSRIICSAHRANGDIGDLHIFDLNGNLIKLVDGGVDLGLVADDQLGWSGLSITDTRIAISSNAAGKVFVFDNAGTLLHTFTGASGGSYGMGIDMSDTHIAITDGNTISVYLLSDYSHVKDIVQSNTNEDISISNNGAILIPKMSEGTGELYSGAVYVYSTNV